MKQASVSSTDQGGGKRRSANVKRSCRSIMPSTNIRQRRMSRDENSTVMLERSIFCIGRVRREVLKYFVVVTRCEFIGRQFGQSFEFFSRAGTGEVVKQGLFCGFLSGTASGRTEPPKSLVEDTVHRTITLPEPRQHSNPAPARRQDSPKNGGSGDPRDQHRLACALVLAVQLGEGALDR